MPADPSRYRLRPQAQANGPYDIVIVHITDGRGFAVNTAEMWQSPGSTSAHFVVGQDGTRIQSVALRFAAQHAHDMNGRSVAIEHGCRTPGELGPHDPGLPPNDVLYQSSAFITAYILKAAGFPPTRDYVKGHKEVDIKTTHDDCPLGCGWDWDRYMRFVTGAYSQIGQLEPIA